MPRRKNQSQNVANLGTNSTENMTQTSDVELKWRDTTLRELQSMFSGSVDPEVVQLVLSESSYNVNDAVEKLFILSGMEQDQQQEEKSCASDQSTSSLDDSESSRREIPTYNDDRIRPKESGHVHVTDPHIGTPISSKHSSFGDLSSSVKATEHDMMSPLLLQNTTGTRNQPQVPRTTPSSLTLPFSPLHSEVKTDSELCIDIPSPTLTLSGLPDFPDSVSQQYKALKSQAKVAGNVEKFFPQETAKHREVLCDTINRRAPVSQNIPVSFEFSKPLEVNQHSRDQEYKGNLESFLKQMISQNTTSGDWKKVSHSSTEQEQLDWEPSKKKIHSVNASASAAHTSNNNGQIPYKEGTSNSDLPFTNSQNVLFSNASQNVHKTLPTCEANKPQFQQTVNSTQQLTNHGTFNSSSKESMYQPPAIQRQFQPFVPRQQFGRALHGSVSQPQFGFVQVVQPPWQQGPQRPLPRGQIPYRYPQGSIPYQPPFFFGRAHPLATVRPTRQASAAGIPFIPPIHLKLLILIRGLPGSGKSTLAQKLKGVQGVVLSTDDFFYRNQKYEFDATLLGEAHEWNQKRAKGALEKLISPVIIDNTNTETWEMKPYVSMALRHGYHIKFIEPDTSWKWNVRELARRNQHGVGIVAITRMKERYEQSVTVKKIMNSERTLDPHETGNDSEARKGTGADIQNPSPRPQHSPHNRGSQDLGKRETESCTRARSEKKAAPKLTESEAIISSRGIKSGNNLETTGNGLHVASEGNASESNASESDVSLVEKSDDNVESERMDGKCVSENETSEPENRAADVAKDEDSVSCSPKPQRVPRVRQKKSPNNQQRGVDTEMPTLVCEDGVTVTPQGEVISGDNHNDLELDTKAASVREPEEGSDEGCAELSVEDLELPKPVSFANSPASSPAFSESRNGEVILEGAQQPDLSKSSKPCVHVDSAPLSEVSSAEIRVPVLNMSSVESDKSEKAADKHVCEAKTSDFIKEASTEGKTTCNLESPKEMATLSHRRAVDDEDTNSGHVLKYHEPSGNKSIPTPPPLSTLLASASRTKQKRRSISNSDQKQAATDERKDLKPGPVQVDGELKRLSELAQAVCGNSITPESKTSCKDESVDVRNLSDELQQIASGDTGSDMPADVEFLKTCFPDVESDLMNALLTAKGGDVMKVVDELLTNESELPSFPEDAAQVIEQKSLSSGLPTFPDSQILASQHKSSTEQLKLFKPAEATVETVDAARGVKQPSSVTCENGEIPGQMTPQFDRVNQLRDLAPRPLDRAQSPSHSTFQLTLEPAVALHLVEMFGPFGGVDFQEDINHEDLIIDVDSALARQLYKKWERSVQTRKGISVGKRGSSPRANRNLTDSVSRSFSGDQASLDGQRSFSRLPTGPQTGTLREIMDEELALELSRNANVADITEQDIATKLKRQKLYEMFPGVDPVALEEVFQVNRYELAPSVEAVKASCNLSSREIPSTVVASGFSNQEEVIGQETEEDWSWLYLDGDSSRPNASEASFQTLEAPSYLDYRAEAFQHYKQRDECFKKAALAFSNKQGQLAQFYAQQGHLHTAKIKEANARAAALILDQRNESTDENTIDLHGLHVTEAIEALESMLTERTDPQGSQSRKGCKAISVITGRGNNSRGGKARIKPAVLEYLKKHNYRYTEPHQGLVKVHL